MKRLLLAVALCAPLGAFAEQTAAAPAVEAAAHAEGKAAVDPIAHGDAKAGAGKSVTCAACHGAGGASTMPQNPKLAGQSARYVYEQLVAFKSGARPNAIMMPMVAGQSEQDMRDVAAYFAEQKPAPGVANKDAVPVAEKLFRAGDVARDQPACAACHGPAGAGNAAAAYPRIGGQHSVYAAARLRAYRDAAATSLPDGNFKAMVAVAAKLSDAEIEALASYINGLQ